MLYRIIKYLRGYVKIRVAGFSSERFMNLCNAHGILLWDVEKCGQFYEMYVGISDFKRIRPLVRKTHVKITLLNKYGFPFFLHQFRSRKIFFFGIFLCIMVVYVLSLFVWNIHLEGNVTQSKEELLNYLESIDVCHGSKKAKIVCEEIETGLRKEYPNILWVSAEMRGTRLIIQIKENEDRDIVSEIQKENDEPISLTADVKGIVESIIVRKGTALVSAGDEVEAGQILVEGYYEIKNDAGDIIRYEGVTADADIYLISTEEYYDSFSVKYYEQIYTEKERLGIRLGIFDKEFVFSPEIPFEKYEIIKNLKEIHVTENFYLPVFFEFHWYLEYIENEKIYTNSELKEAANLRYLNKYKNNLQKGVQIIEKDVKIYTNGNLCEVRGNVKMRVPVTARIPAVIPGIFSEIAGEGEQ